MEKSKNKRHFVFFFTLIFLLTLNACKKDEKIYLNPASSTDIVVTPNTKMLAYDDFSSSMLEFDSTSYTISFTESLTEKYSLEVGDFIVSDVGHGLLRRIDNIESTAGETTVYTSQATLEDVIIEGYIYHKESLRQSMIKRIDYHIDGVVLDTISSTKATDDDILVWNIDANFNNLVQLSGSINYTSDIIFELDVRRLIRLNKVKYGFDNTINADLTVESSSSFSFDQDLTIATAYFTPIVIPAGPIVIVVVPVLSINVGIDGHAQAVVTSSVNYFFKYETGILYQRGDGWTTYEDKQNDFNYDPPSVTADASVTAHVTPEIALLVYGILGAYADASLYAELLVNPLQTPWWELFTGYRVGVGAKATIIGITIFDVNHPDLLGEKWLIGQSSGSPPENGTIAGMVRDAVNQQGISEVNVQVFDGSNMVASTQTTGDGSYSFEVPVGENYRIDYVKPGYLTVHYYDIAVQQNLTTHLETIMQIDENFAGLGSISGKVVDAFNGQSVSSAELHFREGLNAQTGPVVATFYSQSNGDYFASNLPAGNYTVEVSKQDYSTAFASILCIGNQTTPNQNISITPIIDDDEIRIVLDWGASPSDLDSHLTGPIPYSNDRFHVFYAQSQFNYNNTIYAALDYDVVNSYGPETISIYEQTAGMYRYSVHDYTNRHSNNSLALSNSSARVRVYKGSNLLDTFHVPSNVGGTLWTVFEMDGDQIVPVNNMSYESNPGSITKSTDAGLLRNLPQKK